MIKIIITGCCGSYVRLYVAKLKIVCLTLVIASDTSGLPDN